jgi:Ca2+/Na+ antiporter
VALLLGASAMLIMMTVKMNRQVRFTLDIKRVIVAMFIMLAMVGGGVLIHKEVSVLEAIGSLLMIAPIVGFIVISLLWKNPATHRLINVKLRDH